MWYAPYLVISVQRLINRRIQWIIVDSRVYDVSKFADLHPGGAAVLLVDSIGINPFPHHSIKQKSSQKACH
jgi:cytochrome b involved in lipid metabolism